MSAKIIPFPVRNKDDDDFEALLKEWGIAPDDVLQIDHLLKIVEKIVEEEEEKK